MPDEAAAIIQIMRSVGVLDFCMGKVRKGFRHEKGFWQKLRPQRKSRSASRQERL